MILDRGAMSRCTQNVARATQWPTNNLLEPAFHVPCSHIVVSDERREWSLSLEHRWRPYCLLKFLAFTS